MDSDEVVGDRVPLAMVESHGVIFPRLTMWKSGHGLGDWHCKLSERSGDAMMYQTIVEDDPEKGLPWCCSPGSTFRDGCDHRTREEAEECPMHAKWKDDEPHRQLRAARS